MILVWSQLGLKRRNPPDVLLVGTDPILSVLIAPVWRILHPRTKIVHWCFDLYPEAAYADGILRQGSLIARAIEGLLRLSYPVCDRIVDIGPCMRALLARYTTSVPFDTLVPWALSEPEAALDTAEDERAMIFGDVKLALLYSGTMGRAHSYDELLSLLRTMKGASVHLAFSVQGNREQHLRDAIQPTDTNISLVPFATPLQLETRLASADVHIVSLHPGWTGTVVPSKFFGALAVGRPVLFCGSRQSGIARWIEQFQVGWVLDPDGDSDISIDLMTWAADRNAVSTMRSHCHAVYTEHFSRNTVTTQWHHLLTELSCSHAVYEDLEPTLSTHEK